MPETACPELIDLVEAHLYNRFHYWKQGIYISKITFGHMVSIWSRDAGILFNNKWYSWTEINTQVKTTHATNHSFFDVITDDVNKAFCPSGEDVRWQRPYPAK